MQSEENTMSILDQNKHISSVNKETQVISMSFNRYDFNLNRRIVQKCLFFFMDQFPNSCRCYASIVSITFLKLIEIFKIVDVSLASSPRELLLVEFFSVRVMVIFRNRRLSERFFIVMGGFLNAATSSLKRDSEKIYKY
jgi:hypothetical protein